MIKNKETLKVDNDHQSTQRSRSGKKTVWEVLVSPFLRPSYETNAVVVLPSKENHSTIPYKVEPNL